MKKSKPKKLPSWAKGLQKLLMDWTAGHGKNARVDAMVRVAGTKPVSVYAETSHPSAAERKKLFGKKNVGASRIQPKIRGWGWEVVFITHPVKDNAALHFDKKQCVMIFFNGIPVGLVRDFKLQGTQDNRFDMSFTVPLFGQAITEMKDPNP